MESPHQTAEIVEKAQSLHRAAMLLSHLRRDSSIALGIYRTMIEPDWTLAAVNAGIALTDKADGYMARKAAALLGQDTSPEGAKLDQEADKWFYYGQMGGMAIRKLVESKPSESLFLVANMAVVTLRDYKMAEVRREAAARNLDVRAQKHGKYKTALQMGAILLGSSPIARNEQGRRLVNTLVLAGTVQSIISYRSFKKSMQPDLPSNS